MAQERAGSERAAAALCVDPNSFAHQYGWYLAKLGLPKLGFRSQGTTAGPAGQYVVPPVLSLSSTQNVRFPSSFAKGDILEQNAAAIKVLLGPLVRVSCRPLCARVVLMCECLALLSSPA